jgi:hypothetical protein
LPLLLVFTRSCSLAFRFFFSLSSDLFALL